MSGLCYGIDLLFFIFCLTSEDGAGVLIQQTFPMTKMPAMILLGV